MWLEGRAWAGGAGARAEGEVMVVVVEGRGGVHFGAPNRRPGVVTPMLQQI